MVFDPAVWTASFHVFSPQELRRGSEGLKEAHSHQLKEIL